MTDMRVREATIDDIDVLRSLEQELIEFERPFDQYLRSSGAIYYDLEELISSSRSILYVAEIDRTIVASGYGRIRESKSFLTSDHHCYLGFIYVKPEFRGEGLSRQVVEALIDWAKSQDIVHFFLDVYSDNSGAIRAYEKFGFKPRSVSMEMML